MDAVDTLVLTLLAAADICLMVYLRRRRSRRLRVERMYRSLTMAVRRQLAVDSKRALIRRRPAVLTGAF